MRHRAAVPALLLLLALSACADEEPVADAPSPTPTPTSSTVPGTSPSPTASSSAPDEPAGPSATVVGSTSPPSLPTPLSTESIAATPETLDGYRALATGLAAFFTRAQRVEKQHPDADPQSADEVDQLFGDVYPDGVDLVVFGLGEASLTLCMTGPAATFLLVASDEELMRQVLGGGDCSDPESVARKADGDVVVDITLDVSGERVRYVATVLKGQNLAAEIEDLDRWIRVLNKQVAG